MPFTEHSNPPRAQVDQRLRRAAANDAAVGFTKREGSRLIQENLARTSEELAAKRIRASFYEGTSGKRVCAFLVAVGLPLTATALASCHAAQVHSIAMTYRRCEVAQTPPTAQRFAVLQILNHPEGFDVAVRGGATADY